MVLIWNHPFGKLIFKGVEAFHYIKDSLVFKKNIIHTKKNIKNCLLKDYLGNQKWFFCGITAKPPFEAVISKTVDELIYVKWPNNVMQFGLVGDLDAGRTLWATLAPGGEICSLQLIHYKEA